jgi:DNA (cytosine-5)-methyltransferase 1
MLTGTKKINFVDLFCGAGGLSRGLEMAGFHCVLGTDNDKAAMSTFERNHPDAEAYLGDISDISDYKYRKIAKTQKIHLVCGGPPCQGLSTVGEGIPDDPRNFLFLEFVRAVKNIKPDFVVLENVTGILGKKNIKITAGIINQFAKLGYDMSVRVLSSDHFGVPQKRRRSIFIGNKLGLENIFPTPTHAGKSRTVKDAFSDMKFDDIEHNHDLETAAIKNEIEKQRIKCIPEGMSVRYEKDEIAYLPPKLRFDVDWEKVDENRFREKKLNRLDRNKPSPTIMTGRYTYYHPIESRYLTVREAAALQSFPNDFIFEGTISQQWRQIGNAVPSLLGKAIGNSILRTYKEQRKSKPLSYDSVEELIAVVRAHAFDYKKIESEKQIRNTNS